MLTVYRERTIRQLLLLTVSAAVSYDWSLSLRPPLKLTYKRQNHHLQLRT